MSRRASQSLALLLAAPLLIATFPAMAQSIQQQAIAMIVSDMVTEGFSQEISEQVADCFISRMTDDEVGTFLAAETLEAQQIAVAEMADTTQATLCAAEVLG